MENIEINLREPAASMSISDKLSGENPTIQTALSVLGVKDPSALLEKFPAGTLAKAQLPELVAVVGKKAGASIFAAFTLSSRMTAAAKAGTFFKPRDVWEQMGDIRASKKEHFVIFYLDTRNQEIKRDIVSIGTLNYNLVHPREVFEPAVRNLAASVVVAHNHPSGCLEPSNEDRSLTKRLCQAGKILGIELLDHVIVTAADCMSFKQKGLI